MSPLPRLPRLLILVSLAVLLGACATVKPSSPLFERVGRSDMSMGELRIRVRDMARRFPGVLEATADDISVRSGSPEVREAMIRFKSNVVPAMQGSLLQADPVAALIDAWALLAQLQQVLPQWASGASLELVDTAQRSLRELETEVEALWRELTGREDVSGLRELVHTWAAEHPLTGPLVTRESTVPLLAAFTARSGVGLLGAAATLLEDTQDLVSRVDLYAGSLPRQARWQAELVAQEALQAPVLSEATSELSRAVDVLARVGRLAEDVPAQVTRERQALQDFLSSERRAVLAALHTERVESLAEVDTLGLGWVDHAFDRAQALVNHVFLWLVALVALLLLGLLGIAALLARAWHRGEGLPRSRFRGGSRFPRGRAPPGEAHPEVASPSGPGLNPEGHPAGPHH